MTLDGSIFIDRLRLHAFHGVMEQERRVGGDFELTLRVHYNIYKAVESDHLADAISYADVLAVVQREMATPSSLLEHVAGRMVKTLFAQYPQATAIDLRLTKLNPPMGASCDGAGVEIHATNP